MLRSIHPLFSTTTPVTFDPNPNNLPGYPVIKSITSGLEGWALIAASIGIVIGAVIWAFGHYSQNFQQAYNGRRGVIISGLAALLIAGSSSIISFFVNQGLKI